MKWFQVKEQAAGIKRLMLTWYLYKITGKKFVQLIACVISFITYIFSKQIQSCTRKNLSVIYEFRANEKAKPTFLNGYRLTRNYALSLVDKMEAFSRNFDTDKISFEEESVKETLIQDIKEKKGVFFICTHVGNIEILRSYIENPKNRVNPHVNIFLSEEQCRIFKDFLKKIEINSDTTTYAVENITPQTGAELKENLENGDIVFIAGDRISAASPAATFKAGFLNKTAEFPSGTFKLAQLMETQVYFICAAKKEHDTYRIYVKKFVPQNNRKKAEELHRMEKEYIDFLTEMTVLHPLQFYHFYDLFN